jgi:pimeloyl-ACP methyl ester carboxylesterase
MRFTSEITSDGVTERHFTLNDAPGILWTPGGRDAGNRPLVLVGHGGGQHKQAPGVLARARHLVTVRGFAAAAIDLPAHGDRPVPGQLSEHLASIREQGAAGEPVGPLFPAYNAAVATLAIPEWRAVLAALLGTGEFGPAGYWGLSMAGAVGVALVAAEPLIAAAVLGLARADRLTGAAAAITVPVRFLLQWDDELVSRESGLTLFDSFGTRDKTLNVSTGGHLEVPRSEVEDSGQFLARHLGEAPAA